MSPDWAVLAQTGASYSELFTGFGKVCIAGWRLTHVPPESRLSTHLTEALVIRSIAVTAKRVSAAEVESPIQRVSEVVPASLLSTR